MQQLHTMWKKSHSKIFSQVRSNFSFEFIMYCVESHNSPVVKRDWGMLLTTSPKVTNVQELYFAPLKAHTHVHARMHTSKHLCMHVHTLIFLVQTIVIIFCQALACHLFCPLHLFLVIPNLYTLLIDNSGLLCQSFILCTCPFQFSLYSSVFFIYHIYV